MSNDVNPIKEDAEIALLNIQSEFYKAKKEKTLSEKNEIDLRSKWCYRWSATFWNILKSVLIIITLSFSCYNLSILVNKKKVDEMSDKLKINTENFENEKARFKNDKLELEQDKSNFKKKFEITTKLNQKHENINRISKIVIEGIINIHKKAPIAVHWSGGSVSTMGGVEIDEKAQTVLLQIYESISKDNQKEAVNIFKNSTQHLSLYLTKIDLDTLEILLSKQF